MSNISLTPQLITFAEKEVQIKSLLEPAETVTAQHILYKQFLEGTKWKGIPKLIFYIILNNAYGMPTELDAEGYLGYKLKIKS